LASNFKKINKSIENAQRLEPPYDKKGNGTPMVGNSFISIKIFTAKCVNKIEATP
jgi:hypothetical protein